MAAFPPSVPAFFALAFPAAKKSSTQVGLRKILCLKVEKL